MSLEINSFEFEGFLLDAKEKVLLRDGKPLSITPKAFQLLQILVENHGHLVERNELLNTVWSDSFVEEGNLTFTIRLLRKALNDSKQSPRFIETVPKRGYRFIAEVKKSDQAVKPSLPHIESEVFDSPQRPYFLIAISIVVLVALFGVSFVWLKDRFSLRFKPPPSVQLTNSGKITVGTITSDGKKIVFAQKEGDGESLWVKEISSGNQRQIIPPLAVEFVGLVVSPTNDYAYYTVFSKNSAVSTLSRIALQGGNPESISEVITDISISFSPDGEKIVFTDSRHSLKETYLIIADKNGANQKILAKTKGDKRSFPVFKMSPVAWSPDGEKIACVVQETDENGSFSRIILVNPNDGSEKYLSEKHWDSIDHIVWQNVENLAIINGSLGTTRKQIWLISRKNGEARQITTEEGNYQWLSAANEKLVVLRKNTQSNLTVAEFNETDKTLTPKQVFSEPEAIQKINWSKDGKILYNSWESGKNEIWQINSDGTSPVQLTSNSNLTNDFSISHTDGKLIFTAQQNGANSLFQADKQGRNITRLTDGQKDYFPRFTADGKSIIFQRGVNPPTLWRASLENNQPAKQLTGYFASHPSLSPNGEIIAYHFMDYSNNAQLWRLGFMEAKTGKLLGKNDFPFPITQRDTVWHPTNNFLTMTFSSGENVGFLMLSPLNHDYYTIENVVQGEISSFAWSSDGVRLAFVENHEKSDLILVN